jgi:hypothetical protein
VKRFVLLVAMCLPVLICGCDPKQDTSVSKSTEVTPANPQEQMPVGGSGTTTIEDTTAKDS